MDIKKTVQYLSASVVVMAVAYNLQAQYWYKGNMHTHSLWSDGNNYPEVVADYYKSKGYNFLVVTEHNIMQDIEKWTAISVGPSRKREIFESYVSKYAHTNPHYLRFPNDSARVRLKKLEEYRTYFEEKGKFLLINGEEITSSLNNLPIHVNGVNMTKLIPKQTGANNTEILQKVTDEMLAQERVSGKNMLFFFNHPNFGPNLTAEDMMNVKGARMFEVANIGSNGNYGGGGRDSTEVMWDKINIHNLNKGLPLMYGVATDDMHDLESQAGRGWVMVYAPSLDPEELVKAMEAGRFYASSGVLLEKLSARRGKLSLTIKAEAGVSYTVKYIGVKKGKTKPEVFYETSDLRSSYKLKRDDLYVRATIISSKPHWRPHRKGDTEAAWIQPVTK